MRSSWLLSALAAVSFVNADPTPTNPELVARAASLPTVTASGNAFWQGSTRFYVRGIDYQPGGSSGAADPLANPTVCQRDIAQFQKLGVNVVRVYEVDNSANHDTCMNALAAAGIYLVLDVNNPKYSINQDDPVPSYNAVYLQSVFATIDAFQKYTNTLAFFSGNEVVTANVSTTEAAPFVKATTRDMKSYISARSYRDIPVGYSAADVQQNRMQLAEYFNCGTDDARSDFFAFNDYSWCNTDFITSGWDQKVKNFTGYGIPIFLSEWGCITNGRSFGEMGALMNTSEMTAVYSGGLLYEYSMEANGYGIVSITPQGTVSELPEFAGYESALSMYTAPAGNGGSSSTSNAVACPTPYANWLVQNDSLPALPSAAKAYFTSGAGVGPGLTGAGSQNAGPSTISYAPPGSGTSVSKPNAGAITRPGSPFDMSPILVTGAVFVFTLLGVKLL